MDSFLVNRLVLPSMSLYKKNTSSFSFHTIIPRDYNVVTMTVAKPIKILHENNGMLKSHVYIIRVEYEIDLTSLEVGMYVIRQKASKTSKYS